MGVYWSSSQNKLETLCRPVGHGGHICNRSIEEIGILLVTNWDSVHASFFTEVMVKADLLAVYVCHYQEHSYPGSYKQNMLKRIMDKKSTLPTSTWACGHIVFFYFLWKHFRLNHFLHGFE